MLIYLCCLLSQLQDISQTDLLIALLLTLQTKAFRQDTGSGRLWKLNLWLGQIIDSIYENWWCASGLKQCLLMQLLKLTLGQETYVAEYLLDRLTVEYMQTIVNLH